MCRTRSHARKIQQVGHIPDTYIFSHFLTRSVYCYLLGTSAADLAGAPLSRRSSSGIPLARLDSLESTLASLLDFDEDGNVIQVDDVDRTVPAVPVVEGASEKVESK